MLEKIFLQILNMSFTASFVILAVMAARLLLKKAPHIISYALWAVVLFRLVCPFSFESAISLLPVQANPIPQGIVYQQTPQINTGIPVLNNSVNAVLPAPSPGDSMNPMQGIVAMGTLLWLVGIAALALYSVISLLRLKRQLRDAIPEDEMVYLAHGLGSPFVMGLFHPKIYLPASLTHAEKRYILLHEQTHIRRLDHLVKIVSFAVLCLHWFNPLVWLAFFLCGKDMEMSCDESVIKQLGSEVKKDYSSSLLSLATGRRIVGGSPLAFGEGDTKSRIKNVLNYKRPAFWVVMVSVLAVVVIGVGLMANPQQKPTAFAGVNALILAIDRENQSMTVQGTDQNSVIGDQCVVDLNGATLHTVATNSGPKSLPLDDFSPGDSVVLFLGEVQESYPTRAKATTVQLQPKGLTLEGYPAKDLWSARTAYIGDNSAVGKLVTLLSVPQELTYDHFELYTSAAPYTIEVVYTVSEQTLQFYDVAGMQTPSIFRKNALLLLALVENADQIQTTLTTSGRRRVGFVSGREWADNTVGGDVRAYAESPEKLQELIDLPLTDAPLTVPLLPSYYLPKDTRPYQIIQSRMLARMLDQWTEDTVVNPKWNLDSFTRYYSLNEAMEDTSEEELYYCTFSADGGKQYYMVLRYDPTDGGGLGKVSYSETPYPYDLQPNLAAVMAKLAETKIDLSTATATRVQVTEQTTNSPREAILVTDAQGETYLYYFDEQVAPTSN